MNNGLAFAGLLEDLSESTSSGKKLAPEVDEAITRLFRVHLSMEGLSRLFQPGFPGVRTFVVEARLAPDQAIEFLLVGINRKGKPVWTGRRSLVTGREGGIEIHGGFDEVQPEAQSRNITVDMVRRALDILSLLDSGEDARITIDAEGDGRYVHALHGFIFADETAQGPPVRSRRAFDPARDRTRLSEAAHKFIPLFAENKSAGKIAIEFAEEQLQKVNTPLDFARIILEPEQFAAGDDGESGIGALGRAFLLHANTPAWRGALYAHKSSEAKKFGVDYRIRKTLRSQARLQEDIRRELEQINSGQRPARVKAIEQLALLATDVPTELTELANGLDRRMAAVARHAIRQIEWEDLPNLMLEFAEDRKQDSKQRALAYRVLAEYYPECLGPKVAMLRVFPDARIQRAIIPVVRTQEDASEALASLLGANPWNEISTQGSTLREGILDLRLELIEQLGRFRDPNALSILIEAFSLNPPPEEHTALTRALVGFDDPRVVRVLHEQSLRFERPQVP